MKIYKLKGGDNNIFKNSVIAGLGFMTAEILWALLVLFLACILGGGIYLNFYVNDEIDDNPKKDALLITSYIIIGLSGLALFVILLPYIIQYTIIILTYMGIQEILD